MAFGTWLIFMGVGVVFFFASYVYGKLSEIARSLERIATKLDGLPTPQAKTRHTWVASGLGGIFAWLFAYWYNREEIEQRWREWWWREWWWREWRDWKAPAWVSKLFLLGVFGLLGVGC